MAYNFCNDFVNHKGKKKKNSSPLMYDINSWKHCIFLQRIYWIVLLRKAICNVQIYLVFTCKEREQLKKANT